LVLVSTLAAVMLKCRLLALLNLDTSQFDHDMEDELEMGDEE
jgi:hypothetical protein